MLSNFTKASYRPYKVFWCNLKVYRCIYDFFNSRTCTMCLPQNGEPKKSIFGFQIYRTFFANSSVPSCEALEGTFSVKIAGSKLIWAASNRDFKSFLSCFTKDLKNFRPYNLRQTKFLHAVFSNMFLTCFSRFVTKFQLAICVAFCSIFYFILTHFSTKTAQIRLENGWPTGLDEFGSWYLEGSQIWCMSSLWTQ